MTCADAEPLLDRFLDRDLEPADLVAVARHTASCPDCDRELRTLAAVGQSLATVIAAEVATVDLGAVWPAVDARIAGSQARRKAFQRRVVPLVAGGFAVAASLLATMRPANTPVAGRGDRTASVQRIPAPTARMANDARFDRFRSRVATIQREPKEGTTLIWVDYHPETAR